MRWTVSRRIVLGFAGALVLLVAIVALGTVALGRTADAYDAVISEERATLLPLLRAELEMRNAVNQQLRFLADPQDEYVRSRDGSMAAGVQRLRSVQLRATPETRARIAEALEVGERWLRSARQAEAAVRAGRQADAIAIQNRESVPLRDQMRQSAEEALADTEATIRSEVEAARAAGRRMSWLLWVGAGLALGVGLGSAVLLNRAVSGPLQETSGVLASSAAEILAATQQQAAGTTETSAAVSQTVTTIEEVAQTAEQAAQRAQAVAKLAQRASDIGKEGRRAVEQSVGAMGAVKEQVESIAESILALADQAQAIGEIIASVNDIAEQTNLLALNAAVEAARAGDHGRGFAVVAAEIKGLAGESKKATVQVRQILGEIQRATSGAVMSTEQGTKEVVTVARQVEESGDTIRTLAEAVAEAAQASAQILASAGQQAAGMAQIREAMRSIQEAMQQNLASTKQSERAAQDLGSLGRRLVDLVGGNGGRTAAAIR